MPQESDWRYLEWNAEKAARFYDWAARWEAVQDDYFSKQMGAGIVRFLAQLAPLQGRILDYGCGPGYLTERLLGAGVACEAMDFSPETVRVINERLAANPLWRGAKTAEGGKLPYEDGSLDLIICLETIEHALPEHLPTLLGEMRRILKPGAGRLLVTTPNDEKLASNQVFCPECGSVFHRVQHVRSFTAASLASLMAEYGFTAALCNATDFRRFQTPWLASNPLEWTPRAMIRCGLRCGDVLLDALRLPCATPGGWRMRRMIGNGPHLFWFGTKR